MDYYGNFNNEGNITLAFYNTSDKDYVIEPYDKVAQGIFTKYYTTDDDNVTAERVGGIGSTGKWLNFTMKCVKYGVSCIGSGLFEGQTEFAKQRLEELCIDR